MFEALLEKYNINGPRYTSYPTAPMWAEQFGATEYLQAIEETNGPGSINKPLSLYAHVPFCEQRCLFCGCNVVITRQREQAEKYLDYLFREIEIVAARIHPERPVNQFHWGGGTPTYLSPDQMERLFKFFTAHFRLAPDAEIAIEVDPRVTSSVQIDLLYDLGFNRISLGIQDFNPAVQEAIHRIQPVELTEEMVIQCRELGFESLNFDLIYGLPHQTPDSFEKTLHEVIRLDPDRIAVYNYAHVPWISPHQQEIPESALPSGPIKFQLFKQALQTLSQAGYVYIGMDHFAKPHDELAKAQQAGTLHRNFMGYTTKAGGELYGFGVSAISGFDRYYAQNRKKLSQYYEAIDAGTLPTLRGIRLTADDLIRREVISHILCQGRLRYDLPLTLPSPSRGEGIIGKKGDFQVYFTESLKKLPEFERDGFITIDPDGQGFMLTPLGRIFSRNIAMAFDAYLEKANPIPGTGPPLFSKTL